MVEILSWARSLPRRLNEALRRAKIYSVNLGYSSANNNMLLWLNGGEKSRVNEFALMRVYS
jgi:hypothetical protein